MKKLQLYLTIIACGLFLTLNSCDSDQLSISPEQINGLKIDKTEISAKGNANNPSVNGQGTLVFEDGSFRHFSFHANTNKDGSVSGNGVLTYTKGLRKIMFNINCMYINENTATISGTITRDKQNENFIGNNIWFRVVDNGEGSKSSPDQMTLMAIASIECDSEEDFDIPYYDIESGNIQIKN